MANMTGAELLRREEQFGGYIGPSLTIITEEKIKENRFPLSIFKKFRIVSSLFTLHLMGDLDKKNLNEIKFWIDVFVGFELTKEAQQKLNSKFQDGELIEGFEGAEVNEESEVRPGSWTHPLLSSRFDDNLVQNFESEVIKVVEILAEIFPEKFVGPFRLEATHGDTENLELWCSERKARCHTQVRFRKSFLTIFYNFRIRYLELHRLLVMDLLTWWAQDIGYTKMKLC